MDNTKEIRKKTILIVTERFYPEDFRINDMALDWMGKGYKIKVLTQFPSYPMGSIFKGYKNGFLKKENWNGIEIYRMFSIFGYRTSLFRKLWQYLNYVILGTIFGLWIGRNCDSLFVFHAGPLTDALPAVFIRWLYRKPVTIWTTDIWPDAVYSYGFKRTWFREKLLNSLIRFIYKRCDNILVSCIGFVDKVKPYAPHKDIVYVPYWANEMIRNSDVKNEDTGHVSSEKQHFTFAGNIGKFQNLENVIEGFAAVSSKINAQLNIIGDGSNLIKLKDQVEKDGIKNVIFWGRQAPEEMPRFYKMTDVHVISLKSDPFLEMTVPGKFQTCLSTGKPIFAIMNGDVREKVDQNRLGLTADPNSIEDISRGFEIFASLNEDKLNELGGNCIRYCKSEFNKSVNINRITSYLFQQGSRTR